MPLIQGEDGLADPVAFDATGPYGYNLPPVNTSVFSGHKEKNVKDLIMAMLKCTGTLTCGGEFCAFVEDVEILGVGENPVAFLAGEFPEDAQVSQLFADADPSVVECGHIVTDLTDIVQRDAGLFVEFEL